MKKQLITFVAALFTVANAMATNVENVERINVDEEYKATPVYSATAAHNLSQPGWYAGLKLTWDNNKQNATSTKASVSDNVSGTLVGEYTVWARDGIFSPYEDKSPDGSGLENTFTTRLTSQYMGTTTWYFSVTPDIMKACAQQEKDYEIKLTIGGNTYTVVVPRTVTLVDDNGVQLYPLAEQIDISGETLTFSPESSFIYDGTEKTVTPTLAVNGLTATFDIDTENSTLTATEIGTYSVTVNGTGDFKGTATATWEIVNTTGSLSGVAATTSAAAGTYADGTLTVTDTTELEYADGAWTAGITLTWPMESDSPLVGNGYGHYVKPETMQMTIGEAVYTGREIVDSEAVYAEGKLEAEVKNGSYTYYQGLSRRTQNFPYLSSTTWTVAITPAVVEAALAKENTALEYTMRAGARVWGDSTEGDPDGVAFADYKIVVPFGDGVVFALGENATYDLGGTVLTTTKIKLAPGASVMSSVAQKEGAIFIEQTGYDVECSENEGVYTYTTKFTHVHEWCFAVAENGYELVATCANDECDKDGELRMWLYVGTSEVETDVKEYDGAGMVRKAEYDEGFTDVFGVVSQPVTVDGVENGVIKNAGEYNVALVVSDLGDGETYTLRRTVTINKKDISGAPLKFSPNSEFTYTAGEQIVTVEVEVDGLADGTKVTFDVDAENSTLAATEIGEYSVTVNGTGNFTGTLSGTWDILNTTGSMKSVAAASAGVGTVANNTLTVTDTTALAYADGAWTAGLVLTWPMETKDNWSLIGGEGYAHFVTEESVRIEPVSVVFFSKTAEGAYQSNLLNKQEFTFLTNSTWTVAVTPADVEAALEEEKTALEYAMRAGAIASETYAQGVAFADYKIALSLENPVTFALGENETHDLGGTVLTTTRIRLAPSASVTNTAQQKDGAIYTEADGYEVVFADGCYTCRMSAIEDDEHAQAGYMDGDTAVVTNTAASVTIPESVTAAAIVVSGEAATLKSENADLTISIYATDGNGVRQETEITGAFSVKYENGAYAIALDPEKATPEIGEVDFSNIGAAEGDMAFTASGAIEGLWYGVGVSDEPTGEFPVDGDFIKQADGETLNLATPSSTDSKKFYRIKVAPSKAALEKNVE